MFGLSTLATRIIGALILVAVVLGLLQVRSCSLAKQRAAEARLERAQGKAAVESARDAIATQEAATAREKASEQLTTDNAKDIANAKGADVVIHPDVSRAGLLALCRRKAYADSERCRLPVAHSE